MSYKYNRGLDYLVILIWPVLAYWTNHDKKLNLAMVASLTIPVLLSLSGTARAAVLVGLAAYLSVLGMPILAPRLIRLKACLIPVLLPPLLWWFADYRTAVSSHIPTSGLHRLEIWDYMMHRIMERPWLGWGTMSSKLVPISPEEISHYVFADGMGIYPHNQWMQFWVELGAAGVILALAFVWVVIRRIDQMPGPLKPYAYAAFTAAFATSLFNFEFSTDSWIAALAVTALVFGLHKIQPTA
jgi:O-antigen ligase